MKEIAEYELISVAYRSRLLFRTDAEYRRAMGVSFETVANNRGSKRDMKMYYDALSRQANTIEGMTLDEAIADYVAASEMYLSLDWGDRCQMASRKKFCRMLFRIYATEGMNLASEESFKFKIKRDDQRLLQAFFPDGLSEKPAVDVGFIVLFAFGVIRPWNGDNARSRDIRDKEAIGALEKLSAMIALLREDMPRIGATEKPLVFSECLQAIDNRLNDPKRLEEATPLWMYCILAIISRTCRNMMSAKQKRKTCASLQCISMPGIWVDDADEDRSRFWIFPDNYSWAFCYKRDGMDWTLTPYEFNIQFSDDPEYYDTFFLMSPEAGITHILSSTRNIAYEQFATGNCEMEDGEDGALSRLNFYQSLHPTPDWMDWTTWERLGRDDPRHAGFHAVLHALYDPANPLSMLLRNTAPELTDLANNLVGLDRKYIYLHDCQPKRFVLIERRPEQFTYEGTDADDKALFELEISVRHPLYAFPRKQEKKKHANHELDSLADMLDDADNLTDAHIVHSPRAKHPRLIFPEYSITATLDIEVLSELGVLKFTSNPLK